MSPAGAGVRQFRTRTNKPLAYSLLAVVALTVCVFAFNGSSSTLLAHAAPVAALSPAWRSSRPTVWLGLRRAKGAAPQAACAGSRTSRPQQSCPPTPWTPSTLPRSAEAKPSPSCRTSGASRSATLRRDAG
jgi:hypothetical protein